MLFDICQMLNEINRGYLPQKGIKGGLKHEGTKPPQADWLSQDLQDDWDFCGGGRFAGVAVRLLVDQSWLCPLEASFFGPSPP